ncbi:OLC1v1030448C1 [Oldenlandia corymbosa var. corymbosa]|uniref:OLC1v1030448C1 n=1 Tax=Oldenlandia corymbosa var. corymbosa TaxID=529605 RepID=A0AAV1CGX2_OLDCO|nr:OLC1v1030448C1 [Oldenlandia corymbosa var. corymbosa]
MDERLIRVGVLEERKTKEEALSIGDSVLGSTSGPEHSDFQVLEEKNDGIRELEFKLQNAPKLSLNVINSFFTNQDNYTVTASSRVCFEEIYNLSSMFMKIYMIINA